jgi:hypothetical protein
MIIKGNPAGGVRFWSKHLMRDDTNERAEVKEIKGLLAEDLPSALKEMQAIAAQSRSRGNFMYQANINPRDDEYLTPNQWKEAVDTLEKNLGLEDHQRVVVEHIKHGRQHYHVVWNRVDVATLKVADMGGNWPIHQATARELEQRFGLSPTPSPTENRDSARKSAHELYEIRASERSGIDPAAIKAELTELWNRTDTGQEFVAAVEKRGFIVAKGDSRDFCIVDQAGDAHSLARRLDGVKAKDVREGMADVDRDSLPSVAEAREDQLARAKERDEAAPSHADPMRETAVEATTTTAEAVPQVAEAATEAEESQEREAAGRGEDETDRAADTEPSPTVRWESDEASTDSDNENEPTTAESEPGSDESMDPDAFTEGALSVVDAATGVATGLADFVIGLLAAASKPKPKPDFSAAGSMDQIRSQRRAIGALENIRESMQRGEGLSAADIQNLTQSHLENIRARGDDYLRSIIESNERNRPREADWGRVRER